MLQAALPCGVGGDTVTQIRTRAAKVASLSYLRFCERPARWARGHSQRASGLIFSEGSSISALALVFLPGRLPVFDRRSGVARSRVKWIQGLGHSLRVQQMRRHTRRTRHTHTRSKHTHLIRFSQTHHCARSGVLRGGTERRRR